MKISIITSAVFITLIAITSCKDSSSNEVTSSEDTSKSIEVSNSEEIPSSEEISNSDDVPTTTEVTIGNQVWMTKNLNVAKFRNGDVIPYAGTQKEWDLADENEQPAWCYYDMNIYGKLYNWYAVNDPRGLAPEGWKVPSSEDWITLIDYLGGESVAGGKMKTTGTKYWKGWEKEDKNMESRNTDATNESGFFGLPGGIGLGNYFQSIGRDANWWSSTEFDRTNAIVVSINHLGAYIWKGNTRKKEGMSVRCIREGSADKLTIKKSSSSEIKIGKQVWMTKNLNVNKFRNGDIIPHAKTNAEWIRARENKLPAWCYYNNNPENEGRYGKLYNWYAVNDKRGLAPNGWHIPSDKEWTVLTDYLGGEFEAGGKMKNNSSSWNNNGDGTTNESGFSGMPGGFRYEYGTFNNIGDYGFWWSSSEEVADINDVWCRNLGRDTNSIRRNDGNKSYGFSVRCIRD